MRGVAARNNAELCDIVCRAHGITAVLADDLWASSRRTPEYYPDAVTLDPAVSPDRVIAAIDPTAGCSVKDSFASLDLDRFGFRELLSAEWIHRAPSPPGRGSGRDGDLAWAPVTDADTLVEWEAAWSEDGIARNRFAAALLDAPELVVLAGTSDGTVVAGAILNRSESVVGISNGFTTTGDEHEVWIATVRLAARLHPGIAIVGYEAGDALESARRHGFATVGDLRVWVRD